MGENRPTVKIAESIALSSLLWLGCGSTKPPEPYIPPKPADECPEREVVAAVKLPEPIEVREMLDFESPKITVTTPADQSAFWDAVLRDLRNCVIDGEWNRTNISAFNAALRAAEEKIENP